MTPERSTSLDNIATNVESIIRRIEELPQALGRDSGGPETTLAKRDLQTAAYWLRQAAEAARSSNE